MFGMVASTGIPILASVDYATTASWSRCPSASTLFHNAPEMLRTLLDSGILIASVVAVSLNAYFNVETPAASHGPVVIADHV